MSVSSNPFASLVPQGQYFTTPAQFSTLIEEPLPLSNTLIRKLHFSSITPDSSIKKFSLSECRDESLSLMIIFKDLSAANKFQQDFKNSHNSELQRYSPTGRATHKKNKRQLQDVFEIISNHNTIPEDDLSKMRRLVQIGQVQLRNSKSREAVISQLASKVSQQYNHINNLSNLDYNLLWSTCNQMFSELLPKYDDYNDNLTTIYCIIKIVKDQIDNLQNKELKQLISKYAPNNLTATAQETRINLLNAKIGETHQVPMDFIKVNNGKFEPFKYKLSYWSNSSTVPDEKMLQLARGFFFKRLFQNVGRSGFAAKIISTEKGAKYNTSVTFKIFGKFDVETLRPIFSSSEN